MVTVWYGQDLFWKFCGNDWSLKGLVPTEESMRQLALDSSIAYLETMGLDTAQSVRETK